MKSQQSSRISICMLFLLFSHLLPAQPPLAWEQHYNGGSNQSDKIVSIALDNDCNVYVTGSSDSLGQGSEIVTIKYDLNGSILWKKSWGGADHLSDVPSAIGVDNSGNAYVCGKSQSITTGADWITIKYNSSGDTVWTRRYNNTQNNGNHDDVPYAMVIASTGELYVTGYSTNSFCPACGKDYFTIRYDANGNVLNTTSAGSGNSDQVGKKFSVYGNNVFMIGDEPNYLKVVKMALNFSSYSIGTMADFSTPVSDARSLIVDGSGCYIGGTLSGNIVLKKFDSNLSNTLFSKTLSKGFNSVDGMDAMTVDHTTSYVYIAGFTVNSFGNKDMWIIKCDNNGDTVWSRQFAGNQSYDDEPIAISLTGSAPDILVCGYTTNASGNKDIIIIKYNSNGDTLWTKTFDENGTDDIPSGLAQDAYNNIVIGGYSSSAGSEDFTTLKFCGNEIDTSLTSINGDALTCNQSGAVYQWFKDGVLLSGETNQTLNLLPYGNGSYYCTLQLYCCSDTSPVYNMTTAGIEDENISIAIYIYPNPSKGKFTISMANLNGSVWLKITNIIGQVVYQETISSRQRMIKYFDLQLPVGVYSLQLYDGIFFENERIIIQ